MQEHAEGVMYAHTATTHTGRSVRGFPSHDGAGEAAAVSHQSQAGFGEEQRLLGFGRHLSVRKLP